MVHNKKTDKKNKKRIQKAKNFYILELTMLCFKDIIIL